MYLLLLKLKNTQCTWACFNPYFIHNNLYAYELYCLKQLSLPNWQVNLFNVLHNPQWPHFQHVHCSVTYMYILVLIICSLKIFTNILHMYRLYKVTWKLFYSCTIFIKSSVIFLAVFCDALKNHTKPVGSKYMCTALVKNSSVMHECCHCGGHFVNKRVLPKFNLALCSNFSMGERLECLPWDLKFVSSKLTIIFFFMTQIFCIKPLVFMYIS